MRKLLHLSIVLTITCSLFVAGKSNEQVGMKTPGQELTVGDLVPDIEFQMMNYPSATAKLSDFKGKLIILDFWATWCSSCINNFPKLDSLQEQYKEDQLQIILVNAKSTGDDEKKISNFFAKWKKKYGNFQLPITVMDTLATPFFPHKLIPHYVWISPNGIVQAITSSDQVTGENIRKMLAGKDIQLSLKKDINADRPLYLSNDINIDELTQYSIFINGKLDGLPGGDRLRISGTIVRGRAMTNTPVLTMYRIAANALRKDFRFSDKRVILEVNDPSKLIFDRSKADKDTWYKENLCTYDLIVPVSESGQLYQYMLEDLNRYSGYYGRVEKRKTKYLALISTSKTGKPHTAGGKSENTLYDREKRYLKNAPISFLADFLDGADITTLPIINETQFTGNIDIQLPAEWNTLNDLRKALQQYSLDLVEKKGVLDMLVLTEKGFKPLSK